jgi:hypothetical protein
MVHLWREAASVAGTGANSVPSKIATRTMNEVFRMKNPSVKYIRTKPELTGEICIYRSCGCITAKATKPVGHRFTDKNLQIYFHYTEYADVQR